jgi:hypothetical protein
MTPMEIPALDDVEAWKGGAILPPGWHDVRVAEVEEGTSTGGHPEARLKMECPEGGIRDWIAVTKSSLGRVKQILEAFGVEIPSGKFGMDWTTLIGKNVRVFVAEEPKNDGSGQLRSTVKAYEPSTIPNNGSTQATGGRSGGSKEDDLPF